MLTDKSDDHDPEKPRLRLIGKIIKQARVSTLRATDSRHLTQADLYRACRKIENPPIRKRRDVAFPAEDKDQQSKCIRDFEHGRSEPSPKQKRILEQALGLSSGLLDESIKVLISHRTSSLRQGKRHQTEAPPIADTHSADQTSNHSRLRKRAADRLDRDLTGIRRLHDAYELSSSRRDLLAKIQHVLHPAGPRRLRVAQLFGRAGVGKSQLIAEWWHFLGRHSFQNKVFAPNCARLPGDQIIRVLSEHFCGTSLEGPSEELVWTLNDLRNPLIVLDGLSIGRNATRERLPVSIGDILPTDADRESLVSIRQLLSFFAANRASASVLISVQTSDETQPPLVESELFDAGVESASFLVPPLDQEEGAWMLERLGVRGIPREDLERVSRNLGGLPIALAAAAQHLTHADSIGQELYVTQLSSAHTRFESFEAFFFEYIEKLKSGGYDDHSHPHALLRLLAMMFGPVTWGQLEELVDLAEIKRLEKGSIPRLARQPLPFMTEAGDRVGLHPFARALLLDDLKKIALGERVDETTDSIELFTIHAHCAVRNFELLPSKPTDCSSIDVELIEGAIYHLLSLRTLKVPHGSGSVRAPRNRSADEMLLRILSADASPEEITTYCLTQIVEQFLFDRNHHVTRFLGHFETKARILTYFLDGHDLTGEALFLTHREQCKLFQEIGICWMHVGRLHLATYALGRAFDVASDLFRASNKRGRGTAPRSSEKIDVESWNTVAEVISNSAVVRMRMGRSVWEVQSLLAEREALARTIIDRELLPERNKTEPDRAIYGARRILARSAQVAMFSGEETAALQKYELADRVERRVGRPCLTGDAARRFIEALVRSRANDPEALNRAEQLLEGNFLIRDSKRKRGRESNEIIPLMTTKAMVLRVQGNLDESRKWISRAAAHDFVRFGECPFSARMELEIEACRLELVEQRSLSEVLPKLEQLRARVAQRHHRLLEMDIFALLAEVDPDAQERWNREVERASIAGWKVRCRDVEVLRSGRSAVRVLGC